MAVLVEGISVIVRKDAVDRAYDGGWSKFISDVPNNTFCSDGEIARVGFLDPESVRKFVELLESRCLIPFETGRANDVAVVDQLKGPTLPCAWLEFGRIPIGKTEDRVSLCWLFEGPRIGEGLHMQAKRLEMHTPAGWKFEGSLSQKFTFVPNGSQST